MIIFPILASVFLVLAVILLLGLNPEVITDDIMKVISPKQSIRDKVRTVQGKKKSKKLSAELRHIHDALAITGKGRQFTVICSIALALLVAGAVLAFVINNLFLVPVFAVGLAMLPFLYAKSVISYYDKHVDQELETALSIITTSYIRSDDIVAAVGENISYIKPPISGTFKAFYFEATMISSDIRSALGRLRERIDNTIFHEWVDTLIACQDDRTLKDTLLPVVGKLSDVRIVNNELATLLYEPRKEYFMMVCMVVGNIPLLYMLNQDWYGSLMYTLPGKIVLAVTGVVILITARKMFKYTQPIEYKR